jgi:hypothetical protein
LTVLSASAPSIVNEVFSPQITWIYADFFLAQSTQSYTEFFSPQITSIYADFFCRGVRRS